MIDVAVIASIPHLGDLASHGSIDMALTHLVLTRPDYAAHYRQRACAGTRIVLDNSAYEFETSSGAGLPAAPVLEAAARIGATVVICQDVLYDGAATVAATRAFLTHAAGTPYQFMAVPQGTSRTEWLDSYHQLRELPGIDIVGLSKLSVPRCFAAPVAQARLDCVATLLARGEPPSLHLLGGDRSLPWELAEHRRRGYDRKLVGNDSSFAYWYAARGIRVNPGTGRADHEAPDKPDLVDAVLSGDQLKAAHRHVDLLRHAAGLHPAPSQAGERA